MLDRKEAKEIAQFVLKELRKTSYPYATDGRFDYRKTGMGRAKGGTIGQIGPEYQHYVCDVAWTSTGEDTIEWSAGSVKLADGRTQSLNSGGVTLSGTGLNYFWAVIGNPEIQTSTSYYDGVGDDKALLAFATKAPENDQLALVFPFFGTEPTFNSDVLSANMVLAAHIKAGVITANHIQVGSITADRLDFDAFIVGSGTLDDVLDGTTYGRVLSTHIEAGKIKLVDETVVSGFTLDKVGDGPIYGRVLTTDISAGHIVLSSVVQSSSYRTVSDTDKGVWNGKPDDMDDIPAGATYSKVLATDISAGHILLSSVTQSSSYRTTTDTEKGTWNGKPDDMDEIANGATYQKVLATDLSSGHIKLTTSTVWSGKITVRSGVTIDSSTGINLWGLNNALTTRATEGGTIQCSVNSSGEIVAGGGNVTLSAAGVKVYGYGDFSMYYGAGLMGYLGANDASNVYLYSAGNLNLSCASDFKFYGGGDVRPSVAGGSDLGDGARWDSIHGTPVLYTTVYTTQEGSLVFVGDGSGDCLIYDNAAWRTV